MEIPLGMALEARHAVTLHAEIGSPLCARRDLHLHGTGEGRHLDLTAKRGCDEGDRDPALQIHPVAGEDRVFLEVNDDIEVAASTSASPRLAGSRRAEA